MLEIKHALAVETGDSFLDEENIPEEELLLSICNGLVTYEEEGSFLALVHYSFQQYLEQKAESLFPQAHTELVRTCLTYLCFDEFERGPCHRDHDFRLRLRRWPLLRYAVPKWGQHARQGAAEDCRDLKLSFLSQRAKVAASVQVLFVRKLSGAGYSSRFPSEVSALWFASLYGLEDAVSYLLASQRQNVNGKTTWGDTALHRAASNGDLGVLELLLSNGADTSVKDHRRNTPLHRPELFWSGIFAFDDYTPMRSWKGQLVQWSDMSPKVARLLLDHGSDVNTVNHQGETALHLAIRNSQKTLTQLLLARGADVALKDGKQPAPLVLASKSRNKEIAHMLLEHDLQRQVQCGILDDAMRVAAFNDHISLLEFLLAKSSEKPQPDPEGRNILHISAYAGSQRCLQCFKNHGFDLEALDKQKRTCLHSAAAGSRAGSWGVIDYLLEQGLDPNQSDVNGWTPLLWAAKAGNVTNVQGLLDAGADSFYQGDREWIPFAIATYHDNAPAAAILRPSDRPLPDKLLTQHSSMSLRHPNFLCDGCELVSCRSLDHLPVG